MLLQNIQNELADLILYDEWDTHVKSPYPYIHIYRNNIFSNLQNTLKAIYPLILSIVGPDFFRTATIAYIKQYPSRSSNLHDFGEYFSQFCAEYEPAKNLPYLSEIAAFEWIYNVLYFAADHPGFDLATLEKIQPDQYTSLYFTLNPACRLKEFHYPILRIIALCRNEIDSEVHLDEGGVNLLIIRRDLDIVLSPLPPADFAFLKAIANHLSLGESLEAAISIKEDFNLMEKLPIWIKEKTIVDCFLG